jgi:hypothetical protein
VLVMRQWISNLPFCSSAAMRPMDPFQTPLRGMAIGAVMGLSLQQTSVWFEPVLVMRQWIGDLSSVPFC